MSNWLTQLGAHIQAASESRRAGDAVRRQQAEVRKPRFPDAHKKSPRLNNGGFGFVLVLTLRFELIQNFLQRFFVFVALHALNNFTTLEHKDCWNCGNSIFNRKRHVIGDVYFTDLGFAFVVGCQFFDDWTQSFARASAVGIKID